MSTEQPTIQDFATAQPSAAAQRRQVLANRGAAYGPSDDAHAERPQQRPQNTCLNCGREIESNTARVIGDNDGNVPACGAPECRSDVLDGTSLGVSSYRETTRIVRAVRSDENGSRVTIGRGEP